MGICNALCWSAFLGSLILTLTVQAENEPLEVKHDYMTTTFTENNDKTSPQPPGNVGFLHAFIASLSVIVVSELGDKTFFIAAIMAMKHPRLTVFIGAIGALGLMTVLSVVFGSFAKIIPRAYTYYISTALFALFGLKMLRDGYYMSPTDAQEELEEVQTDLRNREDEIHEFSQTNQMIPYDDAPPPESQEQEQYERESGSTIVQDPETGIVRKTSKTSAWMLISRVFLQAFTLTFLAEWGDRSQLTTIILAAREDVYGVTLGGVLGHAFCTGLAVLGGRMIAQRISVRTVTIIGGVVFLIFALTALFINPNEDL